MKKILLVYTMKGCPHCRDAKKQLYENGIKYVERDIHTYEEEYEQFVKKTDNEFIPAFRIIDGPTKQSTYLAPDRDFDSIEEGVKKIKEILL